MGSLPRSLTHRRLLVVLIALGMLALPSLHAICQPSAVPATRQRTRLAGSYDFTADLQQMTTPSPTVNNVGKPSREQRVHLEGRTDLRAQRMELQL